MSRVVNLNIFTAEKFRFSRNDFILRVIIGEKERTSKEKTEKAVLLEKMIRPVLKQQKS
jgi:hypothetical protein